MNINITKIANTILHMLDNKVNNLDDRKTLLLIFFIDYKHFKIFGKKIFNDMYIKDKRNPKNEILSELFDIIKNEEILDDEDERVYFIEEILAYVDIDIIKSEKFTSLKFLKHEEDFDLELFSKDELKTINKVIENYKNITYRNLANESFKIQLLRNIKENEIIF